MMSAFLNLAVICMLTVISKVNSSFIELQTSPATVKPLITSQLTLQCLLKDTVPNISGDLVGRAVTATPDNVAYVTSVTLIKDQVSIATITEHTPAKLLGALTDVTVSGNLTNTGGLRGHLEITFTDPMETVVGEYICEVNALTSQSRAVLYQKSVKVMADVPNMADMMHIMHTLHTTIRDQQDTIKTLQQTNTRLTNQISSQQTDTADLRHQLILTNTTIHHVESGTVDCRDAKLRDGGSLDRHVYRDVSFQRHYTSPPAVITSVRSLTGDNRHDDVYYYVYATSVTTTGFRMYCYAEDGSQIAAFHVNWWSIAQ